MKSHASVEELSGYLDGELDGPRLELVRIHVEECAACRERLDGLRRVVSRLAGIERSQPPPHLGQRLSREAARQRARPPLAERLEGSVRRLLVQPMLAPAFAVVLALAAVLYLFSLGVARRQATGTRIVVQPGGELAAAARQARGEEVSRRAAGRWFDLVDGAWVERGVGEEPAAALAWPPGEVPAGLTPAEAGALRALGGPVRLRLESRVVELQP